MKYNDNKLRDLLFNRRALRIGTKDCKFLGYWGSHLVFIRIRNSVKCHPCLFQENWCHILVRSFSFIFSFQNLSLFSQSRCIGGTSDREKVQKEGNHISLFSCPIQWALCQSCLFFAEKFFSDFFFAENIVRNVSGKILLRYLRWNLSSIIS